MLSVGDQSWPESDFPCFKVQRRNVTGLLAFSWQLWYQSIHFKMSVGNRE